MEQEDLNVQETNETKIDVSIKKPLFYLITNIGIVLLRKMFVILFYFTYVKGKNSISLKPWQYFVDETTFAVKEFQLFFTDKQQPLYISGRLLFLIAITCIFIFIITTLIKKNFDDKKNKMFFTLTIVHFVLMVWFVTTFYLQF